MTTEGDLVGAALGLGACEVGGWSKEEKKLVQALAPRRTSRGTVAALRAAIRDGGDPLGDGFCGLRSAEARRPQGATYTPPEIVEAMVDWAASEEPPERIVDPGAGSARFAVAAARRFPRAGIVAVELDPLAAIVGRGHLAAAGLAGRSRLVLSDYRAVSLDRIEGRTLYVGNPPYVRHHLIAPAWKDWLVRTARSLGVDASQLAGLHVHFFLATVAHAEVADFGAFVTSAEWLDVNYGALVRELVLEGLGGQSIHVLEPTATPFDDATTTAAITCFRIGDRPRSLRLRRVKATSELGSLEQGRLVRRERLAEARRWTPLTRAPRKLPEGYIELGELCRVHRGAVTGANDTWVVDAGTTSLPERVLFASVTRARELIEARTVLATTAHLRRVVDIPAELDIFEGDERKQIDRFLRAAKRRGAAAGYIARHRKAWWSVGLRAPAPVLATYMARRPPIFVRNPQKARHINIAHGLYPRQELAPGTLERLAAFLRESVSVHAGRTYAGGLTKFEPKEMERLPVPDLSLLEA